MAIGPNKVVTMNYILKDSDGNVIQSTHNSRPFSYLSGNGQIIPKLEEAVDGLLIGGKKNVKVDATDAYGEYDQNATQTIDRKEFPPDLNLEVGMDLMMNSPDGRKIPFSIKELTDENVTVDFNHPLAGKALEFDVELLDIRDATPEEIGHGHAHGDGGHHH